MTTIIITKYFHFLAIFLMVGALFAQQILISKSMTRTEVRRISNIGNVYLISLIVTLIVGLILWLWVGKPAPFYTKNWIFHSKLTTYLALFLISIFSAGFFRRRKKGGKMDAEILIPSYIRVLVRLEFVLILLLPLLASFVAVGIGTF